jgi:beta-lactamase class A
MKMEGGMNLKSAGASIDSIIAATEGTFAVAFKDLQTGEMFLRNDTSEFHAASTMKTPVMIEVYRQARQRKFSLDDSLLVLNAFKSIVDSSVFALDIASDSDDSLYQKIGRKLPMRTLLHAMITVSSNLATNLLVDLVGAKNVTETMRTMGTKHLRVLRGVEDQKAYDAGLNNVTTASDLMVVFEQIAGEKVVSKKASREMTAILCDQRFNEMIPGQLPKNVKVAHKTGSFNGVQHDSGFVILPDGRKYILVVLSKNLKDAKKAIAAIASISKILYDYEVH